MSEPFDFVVIGGGSAGYAGARTAAALGLRTAVIEGGEEIGGLCILRGCMPSKSLIESANRAETIRRAGEFGLRAEYGGADGEAILARKRRLIAEFADYRREQLERGEFEFVRGTAAFIDPHTVEVTDGEGVVRQIRGRAFLIATGSRINRVAIPGLETTGVWDSDDVLAAERIPRSVTILGGGSIALEFASYYRGVGSEVTVIQRGPQLLREVDEDVARTLADALQARGIRVHLGTKLLALEQGNSAKHVRFLDGGTEQTVGAEEIVYALGREPNTAGISLERAGVELTGKGVKVGGTLQCTAPHIFAAGDVCGPFEVVHIAIQQAELAARNAARILRDPDLVLERMDYSLKLFAVFTHPELAEVGLNEREAAAQGRDFVVAKYPFADHGKALVRGDTEGFVKLLADRETRRIIGAAVVGPEASELIHEVVVAMRFRATASQLASVPHYHPTLSEIWTYPAEELAG